MGFRPRLVWPTARRRPAAGRPGRHGTGGLTGGRKLPRPPRFRTPRRAGGWGAALRDVRPFILLIALVTIAVVLHDAPGMRTPFSFDAERQEIAAGRWPVCGSLTRGGQCVVDGDTVRIGGTAVRLAGLDAPEINGACEAERIAARAARDRLAEWLEQGPFTVQGTRSDRYGRALRRFTRGPGVLAEDAADVLIAEGLARPYRGEAREGWCG
ncbi:hypothetical protein EYB45_01785 [Erythrobacteraceae bacterium CFH 75059]|uniref:thermonuclease family protein n=1 Tax=Qipengyuania thermophila TaxID=2509361 RepID=UPI0010213B73|nr:thermonuclease family protein [Qipengyuania thermophila]TCD06477.1 hypothetical protein EYB45_01785 [Erythrobacteraceae bacterium CFH 75059]